MEKFPQQNQNSSEEVPPAPQEQMSFERLVDALGNKYVACQELGKRFVEEGTRGTDTEYGTVMNVYKSSEFFYTALFHPEELDTALIQRLRPRYQMDILRPLPLPEDLLQKAQSPEFKEEFIRRCREAVTDEVHFGNALFNGAMTAVRGMLWMGPTQIWTMGDAFGVQPLNLPGSEEQQKKLASGGFYSEMEDWNNAQSALPEAERFSKMAVVAHELKKYRLKEMVEEIKPFPVKYIIVFDDKVDNLNSAAETIRRLMPETTTIIKVWATQWRHEEGEPRANKVPRELRGQEIQVVAEHEEIDLVNDDISTVVEEVQNYLGPSIKPGEVAWFVDYDDTLSSATQTQELIKDGLIRWLLEKKN